jgi:arylsulfatase
MKSSPLLRATAISLVAAGILSAASATKPNIIFILTDDQGYGDISAHGNPVLQTPNLDRLRSESARFTDSM